MAGSQIKIPLPKPPDSDSQRLNAFPVIMAQEGKGRLLRQIRLRKILSGDPSDQQITFVNTYGFIRATPETSEFISESSQQKVTPVVTACMLSFGAGPVLEDPQHMLKALDQTDIRVRKTASDKEQILFEINRIPNLFRHHQISADHLIQASSDKYVKSPAKLIAGVNYIYCVTFLSVTVCSASLKFRVARPLLAARSRLVRAVQMEVLLLVTCKKDSQMAKSMLNDPDGEGCIASVWFHLCNLCKGRNKLRSYDENYFASKCRKMNLTVSIGDMWGPTILVHAGGHIPTTAKPFFNSRGWVCHPIHQSSPSLAKTLWSSGCEIKAASAILQGSDYASLAKTDDIIYSKIKVDKDAANYKGVSWSPFRKSASMSNL
nr:matrix protein [Mumps virus genotype G]